MGSATPAQVATAAISNWMGQAADQARFICRTIRDAMTFQSMIITKADPAQRAVILDTYSKLFNKADDLRRDCEQVQKALQKTLKEGKET